MVADTNFAKERNIREAASAFCPDAARIDRFVTGFMTDSGAFRERKIAAFVQRIRGGQILARDNALHRAYLTRAGLNNGDVELLEALAGRGATQIIISGGDRAEIELELKTHGLLGNFATIAADPRAK